MYKKKFRMNGIIVELTYSQLKQKLLDSQEITTKERYSILNENFPEESRLEVERIQKTLDSARWGNYFTPRKLPGIKPYWLTHDLLLERARAYKCTKTQQKPYYRVSDFTEWLYELRGKPTDSLSLARGKMGEVEVQKRRRRQSLARIAPPSGWELIFSDPLSTKAASQKISLLPVNDRPFYGSPDYVFRNLSTNQILIIEVKVTDSTLNSDGWPNLRAQLWAYAHIDDYVNSGADIILIGEVWGLALSNPLPRQTLAWSTADKDFNVRNSELFSLFCSTQI